MRSKVRSPTKSQARAATPARRFENIEALIDGDGDITVGRIGPIRCAATAVDSDQALAMLVRREGEALLDLLDRLDAAIKAACDQNIFIDEINR